MLSFIGVAVVMVSLHCNKTLTKTSTILLVFFFLPLESSPELCLLSRVLMSETDLYFFLLSIIITFLFKSDLLSVNLILRIPETRSWH